MRSSFTSTGSGAESASSYVAFDATGESSALWTTGAGAVSTSCGGASAFTTCATSGGGGTYAPPHATDMQIIAPRKKRSATPSAYEENALRARKSAVTAELQPYRASALSPNDEAAYDGS